MAVVDDDGPPPVELRLLWQCKRFNALPDAGGMYDQEHRTIYRMTVFENVHNALSAYRGARGAAIHNLTDGQREILKWLQDIGAWNG